MSYNISVNKTHDIYDECAQHGFQNINLINANRRRHFSLEDYHESWSEYDESSNSSRDEAYDVSEPNSGVECYDLKQPLSCDYAEEHIAGKICSELSQKILTVIREAKNPLGCAQVILPSELLSKISEDILRLCVSEPCGIRGCVLYINYEGNAVNCAMGKLDCDPTIAPTFELYLGLKEDASTWGAIMPTFFKRLSKPKIKISNFYELQKKKLYR